MKRNIYIDGENFVHIVVSCLKKHNLIQKREQLKDFDFTYLIEFVAQQRPLKPLHIRYYGAKLQIVKTNAQLKKLSTQMVKWNAIWSNVLQRQGIEFIKCGHLKVRDSHKCSYCGRIDQVFLEKGVDVGLAVDIVSDAFRKQAQEIVLFSADSDMLPAIKRAHSVGVKIIYVAFSGTVNRALTTMADEVWTYSEEQIVEAFNRSKNG